MINNIYQIKSTVSTAVEIRKAWKSRPCLIAVHSIMWVEKFTWWCNFNGGDLLKFFFAYVQPNYLPAIQKFLLVMIVFRSPTNITLLSCFWKEDKEGSVTNYKTKLTMRHGWPRIKYINRKYRESIVYSHYAHH